MRMRMVDGTIRIRNKVPMRKRIINKDMENTLKHYLTQAKTNVLIQKTEKKTIKYNRIKYGKIERNFGDVW